MESPKSEASVVVRPGTEDDIAGALEVYSAVASEKKWIGAEPPVDTERVTRRWRQFIENEREVFFVAEIGSRIVGTGTMRWVGASEVGMLVSSEYRGRGVGTALLDALLEWARDNHIHKVELKVWPHNTAAIALYEKRGFEREGYLKRHYVRANGEIWDCLIMGLQLAPPGDPSQTDN